MPIPALAPNLPARLAACLVGFVALSTAGAAGAAPATWQTDGAVGVNQVSYTLTFTCAGPTSVCDPLNAYSDTQVSTLTGGAGLDLDADLDALQFDTDSLQDVGLGPAPAYLTLVGSDLIFAGLPLFGVPEVVAPEVFSTDNPVVALTGLELPAPGSYPFVTQMTWGGHGDVVGDLAAVIPEIQVNPALVPVSGTLVVLGDVDFDGQVEFEIRDLQADTTSVEQYVEGTLVIDVHVSASLLANLSGEIEGDAPPPVPVLGGVAAGLLGVLLGAFGMRSARRRSTRV
jgi:hypothetical protein